MLQRIKVKYWIDSVLLYELNVCERICSKKTSQWRTLGSVPGWKSNKMYAFERILIELKLNQFWFDVYFIHIRSTSCEDYAKEWVKKYLWILYVHICISCQPTWLIGVILNDISVKFKYNNIFFIPHL